VKRLYKISVASLILSSAVFARDITSLQAYKVGYTDGYNAGMVAGYKKAVEDFQKIFREKLQQYKALEAGKFLLKTWHISYPQVYLTQSGHLVINGCTILKPFDKLPNYVNIPVVDNNNVFLSNTEDSSSSSAGFTPSNNTFTFPASKPHRYYSTYVSPKYLSELSNTKTIYYLDTNKNMYKVYFTNKSAMNTFCMKHQGACQ